MYNLDIKSEVDKVFSKLVKKDKKKLEIIRKKINEIQESPHGYKFLRKPLQSFNRVHIDKHFVLIFRINHQDRIVEIYHFAHHDEVYKWQPKT